jgi:hypothetical protein
LWALGDKIAVVVVSFGDAFKEEMLDILLNNWKAFSFLGV